MPRVDEPRFLKHNKWKRLGLVAALGALLLAAVFVGRPLVYLARVAWRDVDEREPEPEGFVDDASRMNLTKVLEVWPVPVDATEAEDQLARLLERARDEGLRVSIAGARHSMGGHSIVPGGVVIDMTPLGHMELDASRDLLHVQAGAKWSEIIPYLDERGKSVAIMQSNNSFTVGGSLSVNCHGWQYGRPPICSTVESFRLMLADGTIVRCSRNENRELFSLVLGGYGLFGVILDADLRVIPNEQYRLERSIVPVEDALGTFDGMVEDSEVAMVYARMGVAADRFLKDVVINVLYREPMPTDAVPRLEDPEWVTLRRSLFRGSAGSEYGKKLRWDAETKLQPYLGQTYVSRNQLLNEGVEIFENRSADYTDVLHEYFVPREGLAQFVEDLREIIPRAGGDLLNVTVRSVDVDEDTFLRYADRPVISFVMLFYQPRTEAGDRRMEAMTVDLIDAALRAGGRYYLPYRLHATPKQFHTAYPQADEFFALKRRYDPQELFQNQFYLKYGRPTASSGAN